MNNGKAFYLSIAALVAVAILVLTYFGSSSPEVADSNPATLTQDAEPNSGLANEPNAYAETGDSDRNLDTSAPDRAEGDRHYSDSQVSARMRAVLAQVRDIADPSAAEAQMAALVESISPAQIEAALDDLWFDPRPVWIGDLALRLLGKWTTTDPDAAALWLTELNAFQIRDDRTGRSGMEDPEMMAMFQHLGLTWAQNDANAALVWADSLEPSVAHVVKRAVAREVIVQSPRTSLDLAIAMPVGSDRQQLLHRSIIQWAISDPQAAWQWAAELGEIEDRELRRDLVIGLANSLAMNDPADAAAFVVSSLEPGRDLNEASLVIAQQWSGRDPVAAIDWATSFPKGPSRSNTLKTVLNSWADRDLQKSGEWLDSFPTDDPDYGKLVAVYANKAALHDPAAAAALADSISENVLRADAQAAVASHWLIRDETAARAWISQSTLPEDRKAELLAVKPLN